MNILTDMRERVDRLAACPQLDAEASQLPGRAVTLSDDDVITMLTEVTALANDATRVQAVLAGVAAQRSQREAGHSGLAAVHGHPTPASLIQSITGGTRADATRQVRVGTSLLDGAVVGAGDGVVPAGDGVTPGVGNGVTPPVPWHEPLRRALLHGGVTAAQHDAIRTGLGEPPIVGDADPDAVREAWSLAAERLVEEASVLPVEELAKRARTVRDLLDPVGAEERYARRYDNRSFRMWSDGDGQHHARITFDDEMAAWVQSMLDAALRPRRGGPRFITDDERAAAAALAEDSRTNDQLQYDLVMDVLRAGSLASAAEVFGARQPGVRMVVVKDAAGPRDAFGRMLAVGHLEDGGAALPGSVIDQRLCDAGSREVIVDGCGNPLDVGREQRLFTARQRVALAARDGGCLWMGCPRPASYCEAHHCDHYGEDRGRTDIDRGVLLCRHHHMVLHNQGWRITRDGQGPFLLHPPTGGGGGGGGGGESIVLVSKAAWRWAWDPPPPPTRAGWRAA